MHTFNHIFLKKKIEVGNKFLGCQLKSETKTGLKKKLENFRLIKELFEVSKKSNLLNILKIFNFTEIFDIFLLLHSQDI